MCLDVLFGETMNKNLERALSEAMKASLSSGRETFLVFQNGEYVISETRGPEFIAVFPVGEAVRYQYNTNLGEFTCENL